MVDIFMKSRSQQRYKFGEFVLDIGERILWREGKRIPEPRDQVFRLLCLFVEHKHLQRETWTKEQILDAIDTKIISSEESLAQAITDLRRFLGDSRDHPTYLKTLPKHGYRFLANVELLGGRPAGELDEAVPLANGERRLLIREAGRRAFESEDSVLAKDRTDARTGNRTFLGWLIDNADWLPRPTLSTRGMLEPHAAIGESVIVNAAAGRKGYTDIQLNEVEWPMVEFNALTEEFAGEWTLEVEKNKGYLGTKATPLSVTFPNTDSSALYITFAKIPYHVLRSIHMVLEKNASVRERLVQRAFDYSNGRTIPASLCIDGAVIMGGKLDEEIRSRDRNLLLAHRVFRKDGDRPNCWSASFEEQFAPVSSAYGGRLHPRDNSLGDTVIRGLREEFLSEEFEGEIVSSLQAISIEMLNLNLQSLGVVQLPQTSFAEVKRLWASPRTPDNTEHDVLGALPLLSAREK